jgi:hypothetical protein
MFICILNTLIYIDTLQGAVSPSSTMGSPSPMPTPTTPCVLEEFLRERKELDRCWMTVDRLAGKVVLCTIYVSLLFSIWLDVALRSRFCVACM